MAALYELPCPHCSKTVHVTLTQAGGISTCSCGNDVPIPKMMDLKKLPQAEQAEVKETKKTWSPVQGTVFALGVSLIALGTYMYFQLEPERQGLETKQPEFPEFQGNLDQMTEIEAWKGWLGLRKLKLENRDTPEFIKNRERYTVLTNYLYMAWTFIALGGVLMPVSLFLGGRSPQRSK